MIDRWRVKNLGSLCHIDLGKTPSRNSANYWDVEKETDNVWLSIADLPQSTNATIGCSKEHLSDEGACFCKIVKKGTLLVSFKLTLGRLAYADKDLYTNEAIAALTIINEQELFKPYLYWYLTFFDWYKYAENDDKIKGKTLNKAKLRLIDVLLPPLSEQKRIVSMLDDSFAAIDQAIINTEKSISNIRETASVIIESLFDNLAEFEKVLLGSIIETLTDYHANGSYAVLKEHVELKEVEDFAWMVRSTDFENNFNNDKRYISESAYNYLGKSIIFGGEIIMSKIGNAGKVYLMPPISRPCSLAMNLFLIRVDSRQATNEYVYQYLLTSDGDTQIRSKLKGAATQTITKQSVRDLLIPIPSLSTQSNIVNSINKIRQKTEQTEKIYQRKLTALQELKHSILQKAFSGELTADTIN